MSAFAEFVLVAIALYLWESTLWLPLRSIALRRRWRSERWCRLDPRGLFATRELGLIPMRLLPPDGGLAPCQAPPLLMHGDEEWLVETGLALQIFRKPLIWNDLLVESHHWVVAGVKIRISSPRCMEVLRRAKQRGATPAAAIRQALRLALSPGRSGREWRRWKLVSGPLRWYGLLLTLGFFGGLPLVYLYRGSLPTLLFALWLWCLMACISAHLWWLGKRVFPGARSALRMDALLALVVPFHAMRALEIAAVHAMGTTHPVGLMLSTGDLENPWLGQFVRTILFPAPGVAEDAAFSAALSPMVSAALASRGRKLEDYDRVPDHSKDPEAVHFCPRCHGLFLESITSCPDCRGLALRRFAEGSDS